MNRAEEVLYGSLTEIEALEVVARMGLPLEAVPTEEMQQVVAWALDYYFDSGRRQAPSRQMLHHVWSDLLEEVDVVLPDQDVEIDTIESAIVDLKSHYAHREWQSWIKKSSTDVASATSVARVETIAEAANHLFEVVSAVSDHSEKVEVADAFSSSLHEYRLRMEGNHVSRGATFGLDEIDQHTYGIHEGELLTLAAGPKTGKSFALLRIAHHEWFNQSRNVVLFTLENSVKMTIDRLICFHLGISPRGWQRGVLGEEIAERVDRFIKDDLPKIEGRLHVISAPRGARTPEMLVRQARMLGADTLLIDQLTHVEHPSPGRKARHELFNDNIHQIKDLISTGRHQMPCIVAHQISRGGMASAKKIGYHEMVDLAESAGIERASDWVMSIYQGHDDRVYGVAKWQILAARREDTKSWIVRWDVDSGGYRVREEWTPPS